MDPALQAHFSGTVLDRFDHSALQLVETEQVGVAAQVERQRPLRERAELALERADVRVVDVAVADERDGVADCFRAQAVGDVRDAGEVGTARAEQRDDLLDVDLFTGQHAVEHLADRGARPRRPARGKRRGNQLRRCDVATRAPVVVAGEAFGVGRALHGEPHVGMQPAHRVAHVLGVHGEARRQCLADRLGGIAQRIERGPGPLGVHVIGGDGGDAAPVVDPRADAARRDRSTGWAVPAGGSRAAGSRGPRRPSRGTRRGRRRRCATSRYPAWAGSSARSLPARARSGRVTPRSPRARRSAPCGSRRCRRGSRW